MPAFPTTRRGRTGCRLPLSNRLLGCQRLYRRRRPRPGTRDPNKDQMVQVRRLASAQPLRKDFLLVPKAGGRSELSTGFWIRTHSLSLTLFSPGIQSFDHSDPARDVCPMANQRIHPLWAAARPSKAGEAKSAWIVRDVTVVD